MSLIEQAKQERLRALAAQTTLDRMKGNNTTSYTPGEHWKNTTLYLSGDSVTDSNGKRYIALKDCKNKTPANHPEYWKLDESTPIYEPWSSDDVGTLYYSGTDGLHQQTLRKHNSQNWKCIENHQKTSGNAPRAGSTLWGLVI